MEIHEIANRFTLLYSKKHPILSEVERIVSTQEISSIFAISAYFIRRDNPTAFKALQALRNIIYEKDSDPNLFVLFKVITAIKDNDDALSALKYVCEQTKVDRNSLFVLFRVIAGCLPNHAETVEGLKIAVCSEELDREIMHSLFRALSVIKNNADSMEALRILMGDDDINREKIFTLFRVLEAISPDDEVLNALKNTAGTANYIQTNPELIFRVVDAMDKTDDNLSALKNIIATNGKTDLFLLMKVIQSLVPDDIRIKYIKDVAIFGTHIFELVNSITDNKYIIPSNLKKMINRFEGTALTDAFSRGQLESKLWLVDTVNELDLDLGEMVYVCAGWYGVLPALMFERLDIDGKIYSFDIDPSTDNPADTLNKEYVIENMSFKSFVFDVRKFTYETQSIPINHYKYTDSIQFEKISETHEIIPPTCVINTSCEHIENFDEWWNSIPKGTLVIMQNNNFVEHDDETVVNTVKSEQRWVDRLNVDELLYRGTLALPKYSRYMVIGRK